ncbi:ABC transporter ATP-binding protein [Candidatus Saccharibacteria bacterium]|nr:ABC transporter ATP-binding protein [Candidatus Saccharibacteria bacterium]
MLKLLKYLKPYWWQVVLLLIITGTQVLASLQLPVQMADIINIGITNHDMGAIWQIGLKMLGFEALAAGCSVASNILSARIGSHFSRDVRAAIFQKVLALNIEDLKNYTTASLINRTTNDVSQVRDTVMMMLSLMLIAPLTSIISLIMAIQTAPDMSWIIAVGVVAISLTISITMILVVPKFKIFQKIVDKVTMLTRENLTGLKVIRAFNTEKLEHRKFAGSNQELTKLMIYVDKIMKFMNPMINMILNGLTLLCTFIGITLLMQNYDYLGNMTAFTQYVMQMMISFLMLSMLFVMLPRANVSAERIDEVMNTKPKVKWKSATKGVPDKVPSVEFKNVDFRYADADENVLENISFKAKVGETTAFIGSTGSGKSTLVNLIPRFYETTKGEIIINGINVKDYEKDDLMRRIGLVPQRGLLFSGTVKSNIMFGAPNATNEQVIEAARIAQADNFIEKLPGKYNAHISQGGTNVSGGQKQRLSIARAICKNPDIFIFDDSFSALDMKTDKKLRKALVPIIQDMVVLVVAQRVSTIKDADQIVVLDDGKIVGKGKHYDLLKKCAVYRGIVESQLSDKEFAREMEVANA